MEFSLSFISQNVEFEGAAQTGRNCIYWQDVISVSYPPLSHQIRQLKSYIHRLCNIETTETDWS